MTRRMQCSDFFHRTLSISTKMSRNALERKTESGNFFGKDQRGSKSSINKTPDSTIYAIMDHIRSFPVIEPHYCRSKTKRKYLESGLSINKMHQLFQEKIDENDLALKSVSQYLYRKNFCEKFNISFFKPRKDQCAICERFINLSDTEKTEKETRLLSEHKEMGTSCRKQKEDDKMHSYQNPNYIAATFDLQSVLQLPCSDASPMYYKRKLVVYNLSIYEYPTLNGHCYVWDEINGGRGSCEIGTVLLEYLQSLPKDITDVSLTSDSCGGQNRDQHVTKVMFYAVKYLQFITISLNFLEKGHTQMECDSMHSAIESEKKYKKVFTIQHWQKIIEKARTYDKDDTRHPYEFHQLSFDKFYDLKSLDFIKNRTKNTGEKINWLSIKGLKFVKSEENILYYRYHPSEPYKTIDIRGLRLSRNSSSKIPKSISKLYKSRLSVTKAKYADLMKLCKDLVIPTKYHEFYESLEFTDSGTDCIEMEEEDDD